MPTNADYAKIHIAIQQLGLTDENYRDILALNFNSAKSSKELNNRQIAELFDIFRQKGWRVKRNRRKGPASPKYDDPMQRKVVALWIHLHDNGVVKNRSNRALQAYVKKMTGVDDLQWCTGRQLYTLIESLKAWAKREKIDVENH